MVSVGVHHFIAQNCLLCKGSLNQYGGPVCLQCMGAFSSVPGTLPVLAECRQPSDLLYNNQVWDVMYLTAALEPSPPPVSPLPPSVPAPPNLYPIMWGRRVRFTAAVSSNLRCIDSNTAVASSLVELSLCQETSSQLWLLADTGAGSVYIKQTATGR
jgi:hypothetical protein